jgi:hypothetical protein
LAVWTIAAFFSATDMYIGSTPEISSNAACIAATAERTGWFI